MKVYFISGIGSDYRIFKHIRLPDGFEMQHLPYFPPHRGEALSQYAQRLAAGIQQREPFALVGLSLGGIMATEVAKITQPVCTIIISSVYSSAQLPAHFRFGKALRLHRFIHPVFAKTAASVKHLLFTRGLDNKKHLLKIIWSGSNRFIYWGMNAVLQWTNEVRPDNFYHIHGTIDEVFPIRHCQPDYVLRGGHMLVFNNAERVNEILSEILSNYK